MSNTRINSKIKVGDNVCLFDGSYLTTNIGEDIYIVSPYKDLFGIDLKVKHIIFEVVEVGLSMPYKLKFLDKHIYRDVKISYNGIILNTCSQFLRVVENEQDYEEYLQKSKIDELSNKEFYDSFMFESNYED